MSCDNEQEAVAMARRTLAAQQAACEGIAGRTVNPNDRRCSFAGQTKGVREKRLPSRKERYLHVGNVPRKRVIYLS